MPAIRFVDSNRGVIVKHTAKQTHLYVPIRLKNGAIKRYPWLGFLCTAGTRFFPEGAPCKMEAMEVTSGDGEYSDGWIKLGADQSVYCWRVIYESSGQVTWGIYGVIDNAGCPIIVTDKHRPKPPKPEGEVIFMAKKRPPAKVENRRA
jgi:hypothetical protein